MGESGEMQCDCVDELTVRVRGRWEGEYLDGGVVPSLMIDDEQPKAT